MGGKYGNKNKNHHKYKRSTEIALQLNMLPGGDLTSFGFSSVEELAKLCFLKFKSLPKTGKPNKQEWTILSGIILRNSNANINKVVSLGCGTKCIGQSKLCCQGLILNDSHAETLARRGVLRYFYHQIKKALVEDNKESDTIFTWLPEKTKFKLKPELTLHFFSTQTPCGDACIVDSNIAEPVSKRRKTNETHTEELDIGCKVDTVYTGAKLIGLHHNDAMEQLVGFMRTKPGRGERTLSMSCSDKLAKWQIMGIQGALLDILLDSPIYFSTFNFWGQNDLSSLERAIWKRFQSNDYTNSKYTLHMPQIRICSSPDFEYAHDALKQPSPNGLVWCDVPDTMKPYEISVNGKRQGMTLKKINTPQAALYISKYHLLKEFVDIIKTNTKFFATLQDMDNKSYIELKLLAEEYQTAWSDVKAKYFKQWSQKPKNLLNFSLKTLENKDETEKKY